MIKCQKASLLTSVADLVYLLNWEHKKNPPSVQKQLFLTSVADLVYLLNWEHKKNPPSVQKQLFVELKPDEQKLYDTLNKTGKLQLDDLAINCDLPVHKTAVLLLELELKGLVLPLPGKFFEAI